MTEIRDFSPTFQRIVSSSTSVAQVERRLHRELTAGQVAVITYYFQERQRLEEIRAERIRRARIIQRPRVIYVISRDRLGRRHIRSVSTGRFLAMRYLAQMRQKK